MSRWEDKKKSYLAVFITISFLLGAITGITLSDIWDNEKPILKVPNGEEYMRSMAIAGIDASGRGKMATLIVELKSGSGRLGLFVPPYEDKNAQRAAVMAKTAASSITKYGLGEVDIMVTIDNLATEATFSGPSASASMALLIIAAIRLSENNAPNLVRQDTIISASVNSIGKLVPVGNIMEKYMAVKESGAYTLFVVSTNQTGIEPPVPELSSNLPELSIEKATDLNELADKVLK